MLWWLVVPQSTNRYFQIRNPKSNIRHSKSFPHHLVQHNNGFVKALAGNQKLDVHLAQGKAGALNVDTLTGQRPCRFGQQTRLVDIGADEANHSHRFNGYLFKQIFQLADKLFLKVLFPNHNGDAVGTRSLKVIADAHIVKHLHNLVIATYVAYHQRVVYVDDE